MNFLKNIFFPKPDKRTLGNTVRRRGTNGVFTTVDKHELDKYGPRLYTNCRSKKEKSRGNHVW